MKHFETVRKLIFITASVVSGVFIVQVFFMGHDPVFVISAVSAVVILCGALFVLDF